MLQKICYQIGTVDLTRTDLILHKILGVVTKLIAIYDLTTTELILQNIFGDFVTTLVLT